MTDYTRAATSKIDTKIDTKKILNQIKTYTEALIATFPLMCFVIVYTTFMSAYIHPSKTVVVKINETGEANIEFLLLSFMIFPCFVYTLRNLRSILKKEEAERY